MQVGALDLVDTVVDRFILMRVPFFFLSLGYDRTWISSMLGRPNAQEGVDNLTLDEAAGDTCHTRPGDLRRDGGVK